MAFDKLTAPKSGSTVRITGPGKYEIPDRPIIPYIEGDGVGPDIWRASQLVFDAAVEKAFRGKKKVEWFEVMAGEKAQKIYGELIPKDTLKAIETYHIAIKGPLTTPVGGGFRSLNVTLRQVFDLYACIRPVRWFEGVPSPVKHPEKLNMIIFRENTEDVYSGIEWQSGSPEAKKLIAFLKGELKANLRDDCGIGIKPMSPFGSKRLARRAIQYALDHKLPSVTFVHKGNIQKYTEGAFRDWGYELGKEEFGNVTVTEDEVFKKYDGKTPAGKLLLKDRIADSMFQQSLLRPDEYSLLATPNLNGDYLSDALVAQVGGLGLGPGANIGDEAAIFEATHGSAPKYTNMDKINPGSVILSGVMMFEHMGWIEVGTMIVKALEKTISQKTVTYDLARQMPGAKEIKCSEFGKAIVANL